ncbi:MAG: tetratricopeptide repeat protein [Candidatus Eisenbacteria bacterium]|nr:tetratricopeptide repeat protein [Candidatus Eisenbacteria bacterium]
MNAQTAQRFPRPAALFGILALTVLPGLARADDLREGRSALQAGNLDQALQSFEKAASQGQAEGRAGVGQVWLKRRQYAKAMEAFQTAQKMDPSLAIGYWGQGEVLSRQDNCDEAAPLFQKATELDRKFPEAQLALGNCLVAIGQHEKAVEALNEGLKWGPRWRPRFLVALGDAELARDSLRDASVYYTHATEEAPEDPTPRRALGNYYLKRGTWELAIQNLQAALQLDSTDIESHYGLGQALYYSQRYSDALDEYVWVTTRDPEFPAGQLALGNLLYLAGEKDSRRYAEARPPLEKYTELKPGDAKGWSLLGRTYAALKMKDEALPALFKAQDLGDKSKEMYTVLGRIYVERKEWDKGLDAFAKGAPTSRDLLLVGQMFVFQNRLEQADSVYRSIIDADSTRSDARFAMNELGKLRFRQKDYPAAVAMMQRRIALDPNNDEAYYFLGLSYKEIKQYPEALVALRQAATLGNGKADRHFWLGILYEQVDSTEQSGVEFQRSVEIDSTSGIAAIAFRQLGYHLLLQKDYSGATPLLEHAVAISPKDVQSLVWLAQGYQNSQNRAKAIENYQRVLAIEPTQPDAMRGMKSLTGGAK